MKKFNLLNLAALLLFTLTKTHADEVLSLYKLSRDSRYYCLYDFFRGKYPMIDDDDKVFIKDNGQISIEYNDRNHQKNTLSVPDGLCRKTNYDGLTEFEKQLFNYYGFDKIQSVTVVGLMSKISNELCPQPALNQLAYRVINGAITVNEKTQHITWNQTSAYTYKLLDEQKKDFVIATASCSPDGTVTYTMK